MFLAALTPIRVNANLALTSMFELTNGTNPADRLPANCTCASQASTLLPITGNLDDDLCVFPIAFDTRPPQEVEEGDVWGYSVAARAEEFAQQFSEALEGIGKVLAERIRREEETLYPLYSA